MMTTTTMFIVTTDNNNNNSNKNEDNNKNRTERRNSRFFYNPLITPWTVSYTYSQVAREQSCACHVQHIERLSRATYRVPRGTKGQLSY